MGIGRVPFSRHPKTSSVSSKVFHDFSTIFPRFVSRNMKNHQISRRMKNGDFELKSGAPGGTRTHDPLLRRQMLYPAELPEHILSVPIEGKPSGRPMYFIIYHSLLKSQPRILKKGHPHPAKPKCGRAYIHEGSFPDKMKRGSGGQTVQRPVSSHGTCFSARSLNGKKEGVPRQIAALSSD